MVSFSCEVCGDTLKKPKLDQHRGRCYGAIFTCLDCNVTFNGTEYRTHTACISESEKYQKGLYKGPKKGQASGQQNGNTVNKKAQNDLQKNADDTLQTKEGSETSANLVTQADVEDKNGGTSSGDKVEKKKRKKDKKRTREEAEKEDEEIKETEQPLKKANDDEENADATDSKKKKKRKSKDKKEKQDTEEVNGSTSKSKNAAIVEESVHDLLGNKKNPVLEDLIDTIATNNTGLGSRDDIIKLLLKHSTINTGSDGVKWSVRLDIAKSSTPKF